MKKIHLFLLFLTVSSTESISQIGIDSVLSKFKKSLSSSKASYQDTLASYEESNAEILTDCKNRSAFYKLYSNFHYDLERDALVLALQKDTILPIQEKCFEKNHPELITTNLNVARAYHYLARWGGQNTMKAAENYYLKVLKMQADSKVIGERFPIRYSEIARFYKFKKDYKKASLYYKRAIQSFQGDNSSEEYLAALIGSGENLTLIKKYEEATKVLEKALLIGNEFFDNNAVSLSVLHDQLAVAYRALGKYSIAEENIVRARALALSEDGGGINHAINFASRHGAILKSAKKFEASLGVYKEVREYLKTLGNKIKISDISELNENIADVYYEKGDYEIALEFYQEGLTYLVDFDAENILHNPNLKNSELINEQILHRQLGLKARALFAIASSQKSHEHYSSALEAIMKYDTLGKNLLKINWEEDSHQLNIQKFSPYYLIGVQSALALYRLKGNHSYLEQAHNISSRYKAQLLHRGISIKENKKELLDEDQLKIEKQIKESISDLEAQYLVGLVAGDKDVIEEALKKFLDEKSRLDKFYFDNGVNELLGGIEFNEIPTNSDLRKSLDQGEAIVEYFVSKDSIYSFLIKNDVIVYDVMEYDSARINVYLNKINAGEKLEDSSSITGILAVLENKFPTPLKKLTVIPDKKLLQLPFEALRMSNGKHLIDEYDVSYSYSTTFLTNQRPISTGSSYLAFASNYELTEEEQKFSSRIELSSLPFATKEIQSAKELLGGKIYMNSEASKANFESDCEDSKIIHLALHSQLNSTYPDQSALIFQADSAYQLLSASEIYNLDLNSDLTVLSACNSAVGQINPGDGVRSIARSFIYAGSASVLTTLWEAPDVSTSKIINNFYEELKKGSRKDVALRNAKLDYLENTQPAYRHPKYWAHLILVGDTSAVTFSNASIDISLLGLSILGSLILLCVYLVKKAKQKSFSKKF